MGTNHRYALACHGEYHQEFFFGFYENSVLTTTIVPTTFPNKKKAKRALKKISKYSNEKWGIVDYNIWTAFCRGRIRKIEAFSAKGKPIETVTGQIFKMEYLMKFVEDISDEGLKDFCK